MAGLGLVVLVVGIVFAHYRADNWTEDLAEPRQFDEADAYWLCKTMFERVSNDPGRAVIPHVANTGVGGEYHFAWNDRTQLLRLPTAVGLKAASTGSCTVNAAQHNVTSLMLEGKVLR